MQLSSRQDARVPSDESAILAAVSIPGNLINSKWTNQLRFEGAGPGSPRGMMGEAARL
jgi:hypothetical protein